MDKMNKHIDPDFAKIADYLAKELTEEERRSFENSLEENEGNRVLFDKMKRVWDASAVSPEQFIPDIEQAWKKVNEAKKSKIVLFKNGGAKGTSGNRKRYYYLAASLALLLGLGVVMFQNQNTHFLRKIALESTRVEESETKVVVLDDGTRVWLNSNSRLYYPQSFEEERKVYLEGEAYFEVARNEDKPFKIYTGRSITEVLGTSFNIFEAEKEVIVTVTSGTVAFYKEEDKDQLIKLENGEQGLYDKKENELKKNKNVDVNFLSWKTGVLTFENTSLAAVADALSRHYHKNIVAGDNVSDSCLLTSTFKDKSLREVLELIRLTLNVEIQENSDQITLQSKGC